MAQAATHAGRGRSAARHHAWAASAILLAVTAATGGGPADPPPSQPQSGSLVDRQKDVFERYARLESTMLKLTRRLAEKEPDKAERISAALEWSSRQRIKARIEALVSLLATAKLGDADEQQANLLADLEALLETLTNPANELDKRRAERQRIEKFKRQIRELMDEQTQHVYRTQHAEQRMQSRADGAAAPSAEAAEMLRKLEQMQRETQRKAGDVGREMRGKRDVPGDESSPQRGAPEMEKAAEQMKQAADRMAESKAGDARERQTEALDEMQKALDELDDALRQVRKEELEETLAALEARLQQMLTREKEIRANAVALQSKAAEDWTRADDMLRDESVEAQRGVVEDANAALRILVDEGTTVIVPELMRQLVTDMERVGQHLAGRELADATRLLDDIIAQLEEVLAAVEKKRQENQKQDGEGEPSQPSPLPQPLLPTSAELKLMRSTEVRLMQRMPEEQTAAGPDPLDAHVNAESAREQTARDLALRQRRLADLARRMNERD